MADVVRGGGDPGWSLSQTWTDIGDGTYARLMSSKLIAGTAQVGSVIIDQMPAATAETDANAALWSTGVVMVPANGTTPGTRCTVKFAKANVSASTTDSSIVTALGTTPSKKIRVLGFRLHAGATATNVTFNSKGAGAGTAISETFACGANGGRSEPPTPIGHFETNGNEALTVTTGAGSTVGVGVVYIEVE